MMLKHNGKLLLVLFLILIGSALLISAVPRAAAEIQASDLSWNVVANGGATMSSASYTIMATAGQPAVGEMSSANHSLLAGYWTGLVSYLEEIFLPLILAK